MGVASLTKEISNSWKEGALQPDAREDHLEKLFAVFRQIDEVLADCTDAGEEADAKAAGLIEAQTVVMRTAALLPARTARDLLYKLAIWRWDAADLDQPLSDMNRNDAVAYSAFRDLAKMLDAENVLKDFDKAN